MKRSRQQNMSIIIGVILVVALAASVILPLLTSSIPGVTNVPDPTAVPEPTLPPPPEDLSAITFDEEYLHPTGLFTVNVPDGFTTSANQGTGEAQVSLENSTQQSVVDVRVVDPGEEDLSDPEALNRIFNETWLSESWTDYASWEESARNFVGEDLELDFALTQSGQDYIARQKSWTDGDLVYSVRAITLPNSADYLVHLLDNVSDSVAVNPLYVDSPLDWNGYQDTVGGSIIRFPRNWRVADQAEGQSSTITDGIYTLVIESDDEPIADADAAETWIMNWRPGVEILATEEIERDGAAGYSVAYSRTTVDGDIESGLAILLNSENRAQVASVRYPTEGVVDLNTIESGSPDRLPLDVLDTFYLIDPDVVEAEAEATEEAE